MHFCLFLHLVQNDSIFSGKSAWNAAEEESLLDAMDMFSFGSWYVCDAVSFLCFAKYILT